MRGPQNSHFPLIFLLETVIFCFCLLALFKIQILLLPPLYLPDINYLFDS